MDKLSKKNYNMVLEDVCKRLSREGVEERCRRVVEMRLLTWKGQMEDIDAEVAQIMKEETRVYLKNFIFHYLQKNDIKRMLNIGNNTNEVGNNGSNIGKELMGESVWYMRRAQEHWQQRVVRSVHSMSTELAVPLLKKRSDKEQREMVAKWGELSTNDLDLSKFRPVYAAKDFLEVVCSLRNPNINEQVTNEEQNHVTAGLMKVNLKPKQFAELRRSFSDLHTSKQQSGLDDRHSEAFKHHRRKLAEEVMEEGLSEKAQDYLKKGCPVSLRGALWMLSLGCEVSHEASLHWERLKRAVVVHDLMVDSLIYKDVKLTATNDDKYFVFEDFLYQVLLCFSRDKQVLSRLKPTSLYNNSNNRHRNNNNTGTGQLKHTDQPYPPNGVIPFHGFTMYLAALCYVYDNPVSLYLVFREMYTRHLHHLHTISSSTQGIVALCVQFECILLSREPQLFLHLRSLSLQPLKIAFKWMLRAFSGYLSCEQVLILWDRIIAHNSLTILPLLAASIFSFRKANLMQVSSSTSAENIMVDILTLEVIPLIQLFLFTDKLIN